VHHDKIVWNQKFADKANRSASPIAPNITRPGIKSRNNFKVTKHLKEKADTFIDPKVFLSSMNNNKTSTFDYLHSKSLNKSQLSRTNKNELNSQKFNDSCNFVKSHGTSSNLGIYNNKTFCSVTHPKRATTSLNKYKDEVSQKRSSKKFRNKVNIQNGSSSANSAFYLRKSKCEDTLNYSGNFTANMKSGEKALFPIKEVLNQTRINQTSNNNTISDPLKNSDSSRRSKPSLLENINNAIDKGVIDFRMPAIKDFGLSDNSVNYDDVGEFTKNLNLMNIQKSVLASASAEKRESRLLNDVAEDALLHVSGKKSNSS
jgi:hypothetical protein